MEASPLRSVSSKDEEQWVVYLGTLRVPWASAVVPYLSPSEIVEGIALAGTVINRDGTSTFTSCHQYLNGNPLL